MVLLRLVVVGLFVKVVCMLFLSRVWMVGRLLLKVVRILLVFCL